MHYFRALANAYALTFVVGAATGLPAHAQIRNVAPAVAPPVYGVADLASMSTERRIALVIGNGAYKDNPLRNPPNDARSIAAKLRELGFDVDLRIDQSRDQMGGALKDFGNRLKRPNAVGVFYFAGHGAQAKGRNVLIPVDADIQSEDEIQFQGVDLNQVFDRMESARNAVNLVILDACRNNPFAANFRSVASGLTLVDAPSGTFIAFATAPGGVASDGTGENGVYTKHILLNIGEPGQPIETIFKRVRVGVRADTGNQQTPWDNSSLTADFYFRAVAPSNSSPGVRTQDGPEEAVWAAAEEGKGLYDYFTYLQKYPTGNHKIEALCILWWITATYNAANPPPVMAETHHPKSPSRRHASTWICPSS